MMGSGMTPRERTALALEIAAATGDSAQHACSCGTGQSSSAEPAPDPAQPHRSELASRIDQSLSRPGATASDVDLFISSSSALGFRSIYVPPRWASLATLALSSSEALVGSLVGYPDGTALTPTKCQETETLLRLGVREISMVADIGALRSDDLDGAFVDIRAVANITECRNVRLNVILQLPLLTAQQKVQACAIAKLAGAQGVISSAPRSGTGSDLADIELMRSAVGGDLDVIAGGGINKPEDADHALAAGATRILTSHGIEIIHASRL